MCWCIWTSRNDWIFNQIDPRIESCRSRFFKELALVTHRAKEQYAEDIKACIANII
jgi:hypothetical protein